MPKRFSLLEILIAGSLLAAVALWALAFLELR
jgi:type II secretory pathway component PulJ